MTTAEKNYIGFDPLVWVDRLQDVNADSQFTDVERAIIQRHLSALRSDLKRGVDTPLLPMAEAPRDGSSIIARLKPARTPGIESRRKTRDRKVGWRKSDNEGAASNAGMWLDRTIAGCYWQDENFEGWRPA